MSLQRKALILIAVTLCGLVAVVHLLTTGILRRGYADLEQEAAGRTAAGVRSAVARVVAGMEVTLEGWARDESTLKALGSAGTQEERDRVAPLIRTANVDFVAFVRPERDAAFGALYDRDQDCLWPVTPGLGRYLAERFDPAKRGGVSGPFNGILTLPEGPLFVAGRPTQASDGRPTGTLVFGRYLDRRLLAELSQSALVPIEASRLDLRTPGQDIRRLLPEPRGGQSAYAPLDTGTLGVYTVFADTQGRPSFVLRASADRGIHWRGVNSQRLIDWAVVAVAVCFAVVILVALERLVLRRVSRLRDELDGIASSCRLDARVTVHGNDEITGLGQHVNAMLGSINRLYSASERREALFRLIALNATDILYVLDTESGVLDVFGNIDASLGYEENEFPRSHSAWRSSLHQDDAGMRQAAIEEAIRTGGSYEVEYRIRRKDGSYAVWLEKGVAVSGTADGFPSLLGACADVTDVRRAEAELKRSEERLSSIVETNADGILIIDLEGRFTFANAAAERILGMPREQILSLVYNEPCWKYEDVASGSEGGLEALFLEVTGKKTSVSNVEMSLRRPLDNRLIIITVNASPLYEGDGQTIGVVATFGDITERKTLEERLTHQAFHDPLTGLSNRALFLDRLDRAWARANRRDRRLGVLFLDLDDFKTVNDSLGHAMGDELLAATAERLEKCVRACDTLARFGGDEFTVLVEDVVEPEDVVAVAERIQTSLSVPLLVGAQEVRVTASIGVAIGSASDVDTSNLIRNADAAMYEAKANGKGRFEIYHDGLQHLACRRVALESELRDALLRNELEVQFQPMLRLSDMRIIGFEALPRWNHPSRGKMYPLDFMSTAEDAGLITEVGRFVLRGACRQMRAWKDAHPEAGSLSVSVNISARQFRHPDLVTDVTSALREAGLEPGCLALEITESVIMEDNSVTLGILGALKRLGVLLFVDDFGTGYSSLSYLRRFPMDALKIDRSFINGLGRGPHDSLIVSSTISHAHGLGLKVIAEGVETDEQAARLSQLGCDFVQGHLYAPALPAAEIGFQTEQHSAPAILWATE